MENVENSPYSWVVLAACFLINIICDGTLYAYGAMKNYIEEYFSVSQIMSSAVGSVANGVYLLSGPLASMLLNKFGCRFVTIAGSVIAAGAMCISTFSPNIIFMIATYGVLGGLGFGFIYLPALTSVSLYFKKKAALAMSVNVAGSGIGTIIMAPLAAVLFDEYGWKGGMLVLAALVLNCAAVGYLLKPVPKSQHLRNLTETEDHKDSTSLTVGNNIEEHASEANISNRIEDSVVVQSGWHIIRHDRRLMIICIANVFSMIGYYVPYMFLSSMGENKGMTRTKSALLISILGVTNTCARPISGIIVEYTPLSALDLNNLSLLISAVVTFPIELYGTVGLFLYAGLFGFFIAPHISMTPVFVGDLFGRHQVSSTYGMVSFFRGFTTAISPILCGYINERTNSFTAGFLFGGATLLASFALHTCVSVMERRKTVKNRSNL
ncbi:hypothetical protein GJ496_002125 [Pomphorhynchus laevis]|nr:hypothetical protein GJ496_002125 [Pomphorhynchus laevis]